MLIKKPKVIVLILNWNGKKDTLACLSSLQNISYPCFETVVIDNGSTDDSEAALSIAFPRIKILETGSNLGYAGGNNVGIRYGLEQGFEFFFLLNNDTVVDPEILNHFIASFEQDPSIGILGGKILLFDQKNRLDHLGGMWNRHKACFDFVGWRSMDDGENWEKARELDYVCGAAFIIRKKVIESIGLLEPRFFLFWEESDFCFRARRAGFRVLYCPKAKLWHKASASVIGGKTHATYFECRNRFFWIERNGSFLEKILLPARCLWQLVKLYKSTATKMAQLRFNQTEEKRKKRKQQLWRQRAALQGVKDYLQRRFGDGPAWIYTRQDK